jgi:excisionase family DNA binding protein
MSEVRLTGTVDTADEVVTAPAAAALKGVHRNSVLKAIRAGRLKATRCGKTWLIRRRDLDAWQVVGHRSSNGTNVSAVTGGAEPQRVERVRRLLSVLDAWIADESSDDEEAWPKLKAVLEQDRLSSRPLFDETRE